MKNKLILLVASTAFLFVFTLYWLAMGFLVIGDIFLLFGFDYSGNLKGHYTFDISLASITVDEQTRKFYGITFVDKYPNIVEFDF